MLIYLKQLHARYEMFKVSFMFQTSSLIQVGVDLVGPSLKTPRGNRYIVTLVDFFSEWPEAETLPDKSAYSR